MAYHDLVADDGEHRVGGIRPSCAANILPVGGLVVQPEGSSGCTCAGFSFQTSLALAPALPRQEEWTVLKGNASGQEAIVDLKMNFGAPGDRKYGGRWFLAFPRDFRPSYQRLPVVAGDADLEYFRTNADPTDILGTEMDWFYGSQARNIRRLHIDLVLHLPAVATRLAAPLRIDGKPDSRLDTVAHRIRFCDREKRIYGSACAVLNYDDDYLYVTLRREAVLRRAAEENLPVGQASGLPPAGNSQAGSLRHNHYRLVFHFAELQPVTPGQRVFDIRVQGKTLIEGLDIVKEAGRPFQALTREVSGVAGDLFMSIEFIPREGSLPPVISGLEVIKQ